MKILSVICLTVMFLITSPFFILYFGSTELYKLYKDTLKIVEKHLDETESDKNVQENAGN